MALLPITLYGDKVLRRKTSKVQDIDFETVELIKNMFESMRNANGIGLAANQVGDNKSIFVVDVSVVEGYEKYKPIAAINPEILVRSEEKVPIEEGCLSIPTVRAEIIRPKQITLKYFDSDMKEHRIDADELLSRVIQHEFDHLQGILFTDLMNDAVKKSFKKDLNDIRKRKIEIEYPVTEDVDYQL